MALTTLLPHRKEHRRPFRSVTAATALVVLLGACGGTVHDSGAAGQAGAGDASTSPTPGAEPGAATEAPAAGDAAAAASVAAPTGSVSPAGAGGPAAAQAGPTNGRPAGSAPSAPAAVQAAGRATGTTAAAGGGSTAGGPPNASGNPGAAPSGSGAAPNPGGGVTVPPPAQSPGGTGPGSLPAAQNGEIRIGMVYALSGPLAPNGRSMMEGFQAVLSKVNDEGGIGGAKFKFLVRDDQFDPSQSKRAIRELIAQKIWAFSGFTPALWLAAKDDLKAAGVLGFPFDVGAERQRKEPTSFAGYQNCIRSQAGTIPNAIARGLKKLAFIELDIEAVHHCIDYSVALAKKLGAEVVFRGNVAPGAPDCGPQVLAARGANPQAVLLFAEMLGQIKCVQAVRQQGWNVPVQVGFNVAGDYAFTGALGKDAEGLFTVSSFTAMPGESGWENTCGLARKYFPNHVASPYSSIGCTSALALTTALKALGPAATRDQLIAWLEAHPVPTGGLTPDLTYRPGDHRPFDSVTPVEVKGGKWIKTGATFTPARNSEDLSDGE